MMIVNYHYKSQMREVLANIFNKIYNRFKYNKIIFRNNISVM